MIDVVLQKELNMDGWVGRQTETHKERRKSGNMMKSRRKHRKAGRSKEVNLLHQIAFRVIE
jgi:hypothetical protein